jgi:hypothetical protein
MPVFDVLTRGQSRLRDPRLHLGEDFAMLRRGILDPKSFRSGYQYHEHPVQVSVTTLVADNELVDPALLVKDPQAFTEPYFDGKVWRDKAFEGRRRRYTAIRRQANLQLTIGKNQIQRLQAFGDTGASLNAIVATGTGTAPAATTWTGAASSFPTATASSGNVGVAGHLAFVANAITASAFTNPVVGVILSNTSTVLTVDQWYAVPITGAAGTTPATASACFVLPGGSIGYWVALSTSTATPVASDVTRTADGLWGDGTTSGTATEQSTQGLSRAYVGYGGATNPVFTGSGTTSPVKTSLGHTWTYTGSSSVTIGKVVCFNSLAAANTIPLLETLLNATATVSANGDSIQLNTWDITF